MAGKPALPLERLCHNPFLSLRALRVPQDKLPEGSVAIPRCPPLLKGGWGDFMRLLRSFPPALGGTFLSRAAFWLGVDVDPPIGESLSYP